MTPSLHNRYSVVSVYGLLALLLMFGSEVLAWSNPPGRPLWEWLLLIPGYVALSAVLLDFIVRYRVRDFFGVLLLTGIYSLAGALVLNPGSTLNDLPRTLFTRVMGVHGLISAEMIGLFLALTGGGRQSRRNLLIGCAVVGLAWGIWVKTWPIEERFGAASLVTMLGFGGGGIVLVALYRYGVLPRLRATSFPGPFSVYKQAQQKILSGENNLSDDILTRLYLTRRGWMMTSAMLAALLLVRLIRGQVIGAGLILCPLLLVLCWAIIWFRGRKHGDTLLDGHLPIRPFPPPNFLLAAGIFLGVAIFAYNLPEIKLGTITPFTLIGLGFTAYGLAWLPTISLVLGVQGYLRQLASRKM